MTRSVCVVVVAGVLAVLAACTSTSADGGDVLVVEGYGAEYQELFEDTIAKPFTEATGIEIRYTAGGSASEQYAAIRASSGEPGFDVAVMTSLELYQGSRDRLLADVTEEQVPNLRNSPKLRDNAYGVGVIQDVQQVCLMYRKALFPQPPTSWNVMWDPRYRAGALIFNPANIMGVYAMLSAAELDGGGIHDTAPGFARIADLARYALPRHRHPPRRCRSWPRAASVFPYLDGRAAIYARPPTTTTPSPGRGPTLPLARWGFRSGRKQGRRLPVHGLLALRTSAEVGAGLQRGACGHRARLSCRLRRQAHHHARAAGQDQDRRRGDCRGEPDVLGEQWAEAVR